MTDRVGFSLLSLGCLFPVSLIDSNISHSPSVRYRALPSVSKIRMLQRRIKNIRQLASAIKEENDAANAGSQELVEPAESAVLIPNHDSKDSESTNPVTASGGKPE